MHLRRHLYKFLFFFISSPLPSRLPTRVAHHQTAREYSRRRRGENASPGLDATQTMTSRGIESTVAAPVPDNDRRHRNDVRRPQRWRETDEADRDAYGEPAMLQQQRSMPDILTASCNPTTLVLENPLVEQRGHFEGIRNLMNPTQLMTSRSHWSTQRAWARVSEGQSEGLSKGQPEGQSVETFRCEHG